MSALVWFRSDLRTHDNTALRRACATADRHGGVIGVFILCPKQWAAHDWADIRVSFILRNLRELSADLARLGIPLLIRACSDFTAVPKLLTVLLRELRRDTLYFNTEYEVNETARDEAVADACREIGVSIHPCDDQCILPPGSVRTGEGGWYTVFTPFKKRWLDVYTRDGVTATPPPKRRSDADVLPDPVPERVDGFDPAVDRSDLWPAGESAALRRLDTFIADRIDRYHELRDRPDLNGTSTLSPYLASGVISPRRCFDAAVAANGGRAPDPKPAGASGPAVWMTELIWREFYRHLLVGFPRLCRHQPFRLETRRIRWRESDAGFDAWRQGRTGYPIVDAAMRQLLRTGWMHNRLRMITAMFLTKDLLIDWRLGERHFMRHLIDGDLASNNGGWQWSASTGTDAAPYFRIFNPVTQGKRFDPDARLIRALIPELAGLDPDDAHEPWTLPPLKRSAVNYPQRICDHSEARGRAIAAFEAIK